MSGTNLYLLSTFPTDAEITLAAKEAHKEVLTLWELLGYYQDHGHTAETGPKTVLSGTGSDSDSSDEEEDDHDSEAVSDWQELQTALDAAAAFQSNGLPLNKVDDTLDQYGYAAVSSNIAEMDTMLVLPCIFSYPPMY